MFNFISKFFKKPESNLIKDVDAQTNIASSISIENNTDGTLNIVCDWPDFNEGNIDSIPNVAKIFASSIYSLNHGFLEKDIIDTLKNHDTSNPYNSLFVHNVFSEMIHVEKSIENKYAYKKNPLVRPSEVFKAQ